MTPTLRQIRRATAAHFEITEADLIGPSRQAIFARPRMLAYRISRETTGASYNEIGGVYGGRDHSTIVSGIVSISNRADWQVKVGVGDLRGDMDAIVTKAQRYCMKDTGGVFTSVRAKPAVFMRHQTRKEMT